MTEGNRRLLVLEDDQLVGTFYVDVLEGVHFKFANDDTETLEVTVVEDGAAAIRAVERARDEQRPFCGGFFDLVLPSSPCGIETLRTIRELDSQIICCVVSGATVDVTGQLDDIFNDTDDWEFLQKPAGAEEIFRRGVKMVARWNHRQLRRREHERRDALASLGTLAAGLAHEIRNPIGFVHCNLEMLGRYCERVTEVLQAYEEVAREAKAAGACRDSLEQLDECRRRTKLDFVLRDQPSLIRESLEGSGLVRDIALALRDLSPTESDPDAQAEVRTCCERALLIARHELKASADVVTEFADLPPVRCTEAELTQILINLCVNAAQAIEHRGTITVRTREEGDSARIEIKDTGCGIAPEVLERIFDPFFTTKSVGCGTGLGLLLVSDMLNKWNGNIGVRSTPGKGSCFSIELPFARSVRDS